MSCTVLSSSTSDFYPRPPRGGRRRCPFGGCSSRAFLSTPSARRAPRSGSRAVRSMSFLSTPSARRATGLGAADRSRPLISIHALREEGDPPPARPACGSPDFYPRPPRGGRPGLMQHQRCCPKFLSTPSARRATRCNCQTGQPDRYFYPRPPRGGRHDTLCAGSARRRDFYPRPPRGGRRCQQIS